MNSRVPSVRCLRQMSAAVFGGKPVLRHVRMASVMPISRDASGLFMPKLLPPNLVPCRYKSKKKASKAAAVEEPEDSDEEEEVEETGDGSSAALSGEKEKILKLAVLRVDKLMRLALNNSRMIDEAFLAGNLYRNDSKVLKKSIEIQEGDILDLELGPDPKNNDFIKVNRVEVIEIKEGGSHNSVRVVISKNLSVKPFS